MKADNLYAFGGNTLFMENLPIHAEITNLVKGQTTHPAHYMAEGWVSATVLEAALKKCGWPCPKDKLATAMAAVPATKTVRRSFLALKSLSPSVASGEQYRPGGWAAKL